ncbi:MAG: type II toxin-antitoxin system VapC family toxin [Gemmatimonadaceae bacterium]
MILADTSVWIDHLKARSARLSAALEAGLVMMHPFVVGELACANLRNRRELLSLWHDLPPSPMATDAEALAFIDAHKLMGSGLGYIDVHLLASTVLADAATIWTKDKRLAAVASKLALAYDAR